MGGGGRRVNVADDLETEGRLRGDVGSKLVKDGVVANEEEAFGAEEGDVELVEQDAPEGEEEEGEEAAGSHDFPGHVPLAKYGEGEVGEDGLPKETAADDEAELLEDADIGVASETGVVIGEIEAEDDGENGEGELKETVVVYEEEEGVL